VTPPGPHFVARAQIGAPIVLRRFPSGVAVVSEASVTDELCAVRILQVLFCKERGLPYTPLKRRARRGPHMRAA
jgi:hypothetical protein